MPSDRSAWTWPRQDAAGQALRLLRAGTRPEQIRAAQAEVANARAALTEEERAARVLQVHLHAEH